MMVVSMIHIDQLPNILLDTGPIVRPWVWDAFYGLGRGVHFVQCVAQDGVSRIVGILDLGSDFALKLGERVGRLSSLTVYWQAIDLLDQGFVWDDEGGGEA